MASNEKDDFENDWTFVDKEGKVDIEVRTLHHFYSSIIYAVFTEHCWKWSKPNDSIFFLIMGNQ